MGKPKIGISSCLLGQPVRYDGGHRKDQHLLEKLGSLVLWQPVCPETECGLPTPREPMRLEQGVGLLRIKGIDSGTDHTDMLSAWTEARISGLEDLCGFIFKARSPSCAPGGADIFDNDGVLISTGPGLFARAFMKRFPDVPVIDEESLHEPDELGNFIARARNLMS